MISSTLLRWSNSHTQRSYSFSAPLRYRMKNAEVKRRRVVELSHNTEINEDILKSAKDAKRLKRHEELLAKALTVITTAEPNAFVANKIRSICDESHQCIGRKKSAARESTRGLLFRAGQILATIHSEYRVVRKSSGWQKDVKIHFLNIFAKNWMK